MNHNCFAGKRLIESMLEAKKWPKSIPKISDRGIAVVVANLLVQGQFFHRSEKVEGKKGMLKVSSGWLNFFSYHYFVCL